MMHAEVMRPEQARVLARLSDLTAELGFYLAGGTAVALHLGHRRSFDLDWFAPSEPADGTSLVERLRALGLDVEVLSIGPGTLHVRVDGQLVTFLRYGYGLLEPTVREPESSSRIAGCADLVAMKLVALTQRGSKKDFVDLLALHDAGWSLPRMLEALRRKFGVIDESSVFLALTYFDDAEAEPMPEMLLPVTWKRAKERFRALAIEAARAGA
jgi:hypothetical protein